MAVMDVKQLIPASKMDMYDVVNPKGEDLGQVQNFMVDPDTGRVAFIVVAFGGVLGLTDKWIAIPMEVLDWDYDARHFIMDVPRSTLERAPGLDKNKWPEEFNLDWMESVYACFGCEPYWTRGARWVLRGAGGMETLIVSAAWLKGHHIKNQAGDDIGMIDDLIIDLQTGYMTFAVANLTAYEGLKGRKVAIPIEAFMVGANSDAVTMSMEREKLESAPVYDSEHLRGDYASVGTVYAYYGYSPYWDNRKIWRRRGTTTYSTEPAMAYRPDLYSVSDLIGDPVRDSMGKDLGKMDDLMIDLQSGYLASAILARAGAAGTGDKYYPLPLEVLSFDPAKKMFYLSVDQATVDEAPAFEKDRLPKIDRQGLVDVYAAYGYTPYWKESKVLKA